ncbi:hypothetical protein [Solitalea lacus]|uniref:hypothetical protein n=1 Tax=Solitalea lacus TaxID=2911172 RepID=UPI001EDAC1EF|nr:hypothetical protein [Solitalea lacus]UKJ06215.1 hypothetical protein L2B55_11775 [Solitalea lacus]
MKRLLILMLLGLLTSSTIFGQIIYKNGKEAGRAGRIAMGWTGKYDSDTTLKTIYDYNKIHYTFNMNGKEMVSLSSKGAPDFTKVLSLNDIKAKYTHLGDTTAIILINGKFIDEDYNKYFLEESGLCQIVVKKFANNNNLRVVNIHLMGIGNDIHTTLKATYEYNRIQPEVVTDYKGGTTLMSKNREIDLTKGLSLNDLKAKYTHLGDTAALFLVNGKFVDYDHNKYFIEDRGLYRIVVSKFANNSKNVSARRTPSFKVQLIS